jgi:hypothetical protein
VGIQHAGLQDGSDAGYLELDSHADIAADIAVLGANCRIFQETERNVDVYGYHPSHGSTSRKIVSGVFAYDNPEDGTCTLLIVHQGLHVPTMNNSLIPPYQMRVNDIVVNKCPKSQLTNPTVDDHAIIDHKNDPFPFRIPLTLSRGTISAIPVRRPTDAEFADYELEPFELTHGETPDWDHNDDSRGWAETQLSTKLDLEERHVNTLRIHDHDALAICSATHARSAWAHHEVKPLVKGMLANCYVSSVYAFNLKTSGGLTATKQLARNWMIPIAKARRSDNRNDGTTRYTHDTQYSYPMIQDQ